MGINLHSQCHLKCSYLSIISHMTHDDNMLKTAPHLTYHSTHTYHTPILYLHFPSDPTVLLAQHQTTLSSAARSITMPRAGQLCHQKQWFDRHHHGKRIKSGFSWSIPQITFIVHRCGPLAAMSRLCVPHSCFLFIIWVTVFSSALPKVLWRHIDINRCSRAGCLKPHRLSYLPVG